MDELREDLFDVFTPGPELVLFRDEATDHADIVCGEARLVRSRLMLVEPEFAVTHVVVEGEATLFHDEHEPIALRPGIYRVRTPSHRALEDAFRPLRLVPTVVEGD